MSKLTLRFRYTGPGRCEARAGLFHARVETTGPHRRPYHAALAIDGAIVSQADFPGMATAQGFLRGEVDKHLQEKTEFELCDFVAEPDLEARFGRRAAAYAKRHSLRITAFTEYRTRIDDRPAVVRRYESLRLAAARQAEVA